MIMESSKSVSSSNDGISPAKWFLKPTKLDPERIPVEPRLAFMHSTITPFTKVSAEAYDFGNRRWYNLSAERVIADEEWIEREIRGYIDCWPEPFNAISIHSDGNVTVEFKEQVGREIGGMVPYHGLLETTPLNSIHKRKYLSGRVDTCVWKENRCAYKCIDFTEDVEPMQREIQVRESLRVTASNLEQVGVAPILAVVIDPTSRFVNGIVLPLYGKSLEMVAQERGSINIPCLRSLLETVMYLNGVGISHGDICDRNVVVKPSNSGKSSDDTSTLILVDFGEVAPSYKGDIDATADLFLWCAKSLEWTEVGLTLIKDAVACLRDRNIEGAIACLVDADCSILQT